MNIAGVISLVLYRAVTPECVVAAHQLAERVEELVRDLGLGMDLQELPGTQGLPRGGGGFTWALEHVLVGAGRVEGAITEGVQAGTMLGAENEVVVIVRPRDEKGSFSKKKCSLIMDFFQKGGGGSEAIQKFWDTFCAPTILEFWVEKGGG